MGDKSPKAKERQKKQDAADSKLPVITAPAVTPAPAPAVQPATTPPVEAKP